MLIRREQFSNLERPATLLDGTAFRLVWLLMASQGTSRGERVEVPVDAVFTTDTHFLNGNGRVVMFARG